jgi:hypothetical protein
MMLFKKNMGEKDDIDNDCDYDHEGEKECFTKFGVSRPRGGQGLRRFFGSGFLFI